MVVGRLAVLAARDKEAGLYEDGFARRKGYIAELLASIGKNSVLYILYTIDTVAFSHSVILLIVAVVDTQAQID